MTPTRLYFLSITLLALSACQNSATPNKNTIQSETSAEEPMETKTALERGKEAAHEARGALLSQVSMALQQGGPAYAVSYCNLKATGIADSVGKLHQAEISRIARRHRNPKNFIETPADSAVYAQFEATQAAGNSPQAVVKETAAGRYFYQPIMLKLEACLKCHGTPNKQVKPKTLEAIAQAYPNDKAVNFALGDLRGAWKIKLN
jgi:hypothetical protein